jgi:hypothetical protein
MKRNHTRSAALVGIAAAAALAAAGALASAVTGPSSSKSPYLLRSQPGVVTKAILTVGDSVNAKPDGTPYRLVGIPDGLGAFDNGDGTFTVLMNHELGNTQGIVRAHGSRGAFVSRWTVEKGTLRVRHGEDLIRRVQLRNAASGSWIEGTTAFNRFCSADLPAASAFLDAASGKGYGGRLFLNGEEAGAEGRAFAHELDGTSWQLPHLGRYSYENAVPGIAPGERTVVVGLDDSGNGQVYVYVGEKRSTGTAIERAGLVGGRLYGVKAAGVLTETDATEIAPGTPFELVDLGDVSGLSGAQLEAASNAAGVTRWQRPEDGAWNPRRPSQFVWVTTASFAGKSRLWSLDFADPQAPEQGGTITALLDGTEGQKMFDNLTVSDRGLVLLQEDPGAQDHLAKVWGYSLATGAFTELATHDPARFSPGEEGFLTRDEESSGIVPAPFLGEGWYLLDVQAHYATDAETVQGGQLLAMHVPPGRFR